MVLKPTKAYRYELKLAVAAGGGAERSLLGNSTPKFKPWFTTTQKHKPPNEEGK